MEILRNEDFSYFILEMYCQGDKIKRDEIRVTSIPRGRVRSENGNLIGKLKVHHLEYLGTWWASGF